MQCMWVCLNPLCGICSLAFSYVVIPNLQIFLSCWYQQFICLPVFVTGSIKSKDNTCDLWLVSHYKYWFTCSLLAWKKIKCREKKRERSRSITQIHFSSLTWNSTAELKSTSGGSLDDDISTKLVFLCHDFP